MFQHAQKNNRTILSHPNAWLPYLPRWVFVTLPFNWQKICTEGPRNMEQTRTTQPSQAAPFGAPLDISLHVQCVELIRPSSQKHSLSSSLCLAQTEQFPALQSWKLTGCWTIFLLGKPPIIHFQDWTEGKPGIPSFCINCCSVDLANKLNLFAQLF